MKYLKKFESLFGELEPELFFDRNLQGQKEMT